MSEQEENTTDQHNTTLVLKSLPRKRGKRGRRRGKGKKKKNGITPTTSEIQTNDEEENLQNIDVTSIHSVEVEKSDVGVAHEENDALNEEDEKDTDNQQAQHIALLQEQVKILIDQEQWEQAQILAVQMQKSGDRGICLFEIVKELMARQNWIEAETAINRILPISVRQDAALFLLEGLLKHHELKRAESIIQLFIEAELEETVTNHLNAITTASIEVQNWEQVEVFLSLDLGGEQMPLWQYALIEVLLRNQQWERAEKYLHHIKDRTQKRHLVSLQIKEMINNRLWDQVEAVVGRVHDVERQVQLFYALTKDLIKNQEWERAKYIVSLMRNVAQREEVMRLLAEDFVKMQQWDEAETLIKEMRLRRPRHRALQALRDALVLAQKWETAERIIDTIKEQDTQSKARYALSRHYMKQRKWEEAQQVIHLIPERDQRIRSILALGENLAQAHEHDQLLHLIQWAWGHAETRDEIIKLFPLVRGLLPLFPPELEVDFHEAVKWVNDFLGIVQKNVE